MARFESIGFQVHFQMSMFHISGQV